MANRVTLPGGEYLDMDDPVAIRAHAMKTIATISTESNGLNQTRLAAADRLLELADAMEKASKPSTGPISLEQARAASAELMRRKVGG